MGPMGLVSMMMTTMMMVLCVSHAGGRTERMVNPVALEQGMVIVQCAHCNVWHKIADAANMVEEYRFSDEE